MAYNFDLKKYLTENKLTSNSRLNEEEQTDMKVVEVYEVYLKGEEGEEFVYAFKSKDVFESSIGDFVREFYEIDLTTYSKVALSDDELNTLEEVGYIRL
jgi:hypothetical protein